MELDGLLLGAVIFGEHLKLIHVSAEVKDCKGRPSLFRYGRRESGSRFVVRLRRPHEAGLEGCRPLSLVAARWFPDCLWSLTIDLAARREGVPFYVEDGDSNCLGLAWRVAHWG